jgi:hypothetical protein
MTLGAVACSTVLTGCGVVVVSNRPVDQRAPSDNWLELARQAHFLADDEGLDVETWLDKQ